MYNFQYKKRKSPKIILNLQLCDFFMGLKNEFEIALVNEPPVKVMLRCLRICTTFARPQILATATSRSAAGASGRPSISRVPKDGGLNFTI